MNAKKLLALLLVFALGLGFGVAITNSAKPSFLPALYKSEVYFSPEGNVRANIVKAIGEARASIDLAIFDITSEDIKAALEQAQKRGVKVGIIADSRHEKGPHSMVPGQVDLALKNGPVFPEYYNDIIPRYHCFRFKSPIYLY